MLQWIPYSEWIIPVPILFSIAWVQFNKPPTNRSGTTLAMFSVGLIIYCLLIAVLWLLVILTIDQGTLGFDKFPFWGTTDPRAHAEFGQYAPLVAALVLVAGPHFPWIRRFDNAARTFCITLAGDPTRARPVGARACANRRFPSEKRAAA